MGQRLSSRKFPNVAQVGVASGTVINQSRVTFSGQRGLVRLVYLVSIQNGGAVAIDVCTVSASTGSLAINVGRTGSQFFTAVATQVLVLNSEVWFVDPPDGSFFELAISLSAGTVTFGALNSVVIIESFPVEAGDGPTVTVA